MPEEKIKVYSQDDVTEIQLGFVQELKEIHINIQNVLNKYTDKKDIKIDLIKLLTNVYDKEITIQKDINIETSTVESKRFQ